MNCLRPLITQCSPSATALVCIAASGTLYGSQRSEARQLSRIIFCSSESPRSSMSAMAPILREPGSFFALGCCMPSLPVLINPRSGGGFGERDAKRLDELLRSAGAEPSIRLARSHEELVAAAKQLVGARAPLVVAGGGDGTMNAVASVLAGSDTALGVLPLGTLNHFA